MFAFLPLIFSRVKKMFDCALEFMKDFSNLIPTGIVLILVLNLVSDLLFGGGK